MEDKSKLRKEIAEQTKAFLEAGGVIEVIPPVSFCPKSMEWARDRGMDWMPWERQGDFADSRYHWLGEGGYLTKPQHLED